MGADPILYCLAELTDYRQFERLCTDLMFAEGYRNIEPLGGVKDSGRDAVQRGDKGNENVIFAYSTEKDWKSKVKCDMETVAKHSHPCERFVFVTTASLSARGIDDVQKLATEKYKWKLELYGDERLRLLLSMRPEVISKYPQIFSIQNPPPEKVTKEVKIALSWSAGVSTNCESLKDILADALLMIQRKQPFEFKIELDQVRELSKAIQELEQKSPESKQEVLKLESWVYAKQEKLEVMEKVLAKLFSPQLIDYLIYRLDDLVMTVQGLPDVLSLVEFKDHSNESKIPIELKCQLPNGLNVVVRIEMSDIEYSETMQNYHKNLSANPNASLDFYHLPFAYRNSIAYPHMLVAICKQHDEVRNFKLEDALLPLDWCFRFC